MSTCCRVLTARLYEWKQLAADYILATGSSVGVSMTQIETTVHKRAKKGKKHIIPNKPSKTSTNIIHLLNRTVGLSSQKRACRKVRGLRLNPQNCAVLNQALCNVWRC